MNIPTRLCLATALLVALLLPDGARADSALIVVGGSASFGPEHSCLSFAGVRSDTTDRSRWVAGSYWPSLPEPSDTGLCPEEEPHSHVTPVCVEATRSEEGTILDLRLRDDDQRNTFYAVRIVDRGPGLPPLVGLTADPQDGPGCVATELEVAPASGGAFVVVAVP